MLQQSSVTATVKIVALQMCGWRLTRMHLGPRKLTVRWCDDGCPSRSLHDARERPRRWHCFGLTVAHRVYFKMPANVRGGGIVLDSSWIW